MKALYIFIAAVFVSLSAAAAAEEQLDRNIEITAPPAALGFDPFYKKYMDCDGISVIGSEKVDDRAFYRLKYLLDKMLSTRPEMRQALVRDGVRYIIIAAEEQVTDVPEYSNMKPKAFWNERARGFGGRVTSCGEENLLSLPTDRYEDESIFIHELAHAIDSRCLRLIEPEFKQRLEELYEEAMAKGLYKHDYAATNIAEYWAESVQAYFDADRENNWNHNDINTREELNEYDPKMARFVQEMFLVNNQNDWRYRPLKKQPSVINVPEEIKKASAISKYVWCRGFSIMSTGKASDEALLEADRIVRNMFRYRHDILKAIINADVQLVVLGRAEKAGQLDHAKPLNPQLFEHKGLVSRAQSPPVRIAIPQRQLLNHQSWEKSGGSKLVHDMALLVYFVTGMREIDPDYANQKNVQQYEKGLDRNDNRFDEEMKKLYQNAKEQNLWQDTAAMKSRFRYFAEGVQSYFNANHIELSNGKTINNRENLKKHDPKLAAFIASIFKHEERVDWRVKK